MSYWLVHHVSYMFLGILEKGVILLLMMFFNRFLKEIWFVFINNEKCPPALIIS